MHLWCRLSFSRLTS